MAAERPHRIADPVHGTIELSSVEAEIISTPTYQRLRHVKQLGLAYLVFPGADYSRFSHSIGTCHVTKRICDSLQTNCPHLKLSDEDSQIYRLAGLLHDVGHYPFSHTMENAISDHYRSGLLDKSDAEQPGETIDDKIYKHEDVGAEIVTGESDISAVLKRHSINPEQVADIFNRKNPPKLANLISSDLDADRLDYLLRTAHHTGLPYGNVDLSYILSEMRVDDEKRICLTDKALRAAEHMLLCRYFDYQQVSFNKTVASLEWLLADCLKEMIGQGLIDCSAKGIRDRLQSGRWKHFDDAYVTHEMRKFASENPNSNASIKANALLNRTPPKMVAHIEFMGRRERAGEFANCERIVKDTVKLLAGSYGIDPDLWHIWTRAGIALTKMGSYIPVSEALSVSEKDTDRFEQSIRILDKGGRKSTDIMSIKNSLMSVLSDSALFSLKVFLVLPHEKMGLRQEITTKFVEALPHYLA